MLISKGFQTATGEKTASFGSLDQSGLYASVTRPNAPPRDTIALKTALLGTDPEVEGFFNRAI